MPNQVLPTDGLVFARQARDKAVQSGQDGTSITSDQEDASDAEFHGGHATASLSPKAAWTP